MKYINFKGPYGTETIDEFETMKEARTNLKEYRISDRSHTYHISQRCTKEWSG